MIAQSRIREVPMVAVIVLLSLVVPILEVLLFVAVVNSAGIWAAVIPSAVTTVAGLVILIRSFPKFMDSTFNNDKFQTFPTMQSYFEVTKILSGMLLLVPGFITDLAGLILLHPKLRGVSFVILSRLMVRKNDRY